MHPQPDVLLRRGGRSHGPTAGYLQVTRTKLPQRTTPSRRPSPRRWAAGAVLRGAAMYSSMDAVLASGDATESCTQLIIRHGFARAAFALYEPDCFVCCRGALTLREAGVDVRAYPALTGGVWEANAHLKR